MRKFFMTAVATIAFASVATAQDSRLYFTIANQGGFAGSDGIWVAANGATTNRTIFLAPTDQNTALSGTLACASTYNQGSVGLNMAVGTKGAGCGDETITSVGVNIDVVGAGLGTSFQLNNTAGSVGTVNAPWSGINPAGAAVGSPDISDLRAVRVPASSAAAEWQGLGPTPACSAGAAAAYNVGTLSLTGPATLVGGEQSFDVFLQVGALKITRAYDPAAAQGTQPEMVNFGYGDAAVSGSSNTPVASTTADLTVLIRKKGDFGVVDGNTGVLISPVRDGSVSNAESNYMNLQAGTTDPALLFAGDFGQVDGNTGTVISCVPDGILSNAESIAHSLFAVGT